MQDLLEQIMIEFEKFRNADYCDDEATEEFIDYMYEAYKKYKKVVDK